MVYNVSRRIFLSTCSSQNNLRNLKTCQNSGEDWTVCPENPQCTKHYDDLGRRRRVLHAAGGGRREGSTITAVANLAKKSGLFLKKKKKSCSSVHVPPHLHIHKERGPKR